MRKRDEMSTATAYGQLAPESFVPLDSESQSEYRHGVVSTNADDKEIKVQEVICRQSKVPSWVYWMLHPAIGWSVALLAAVYSIVSVLQGKPIMLIAYAPATVAFAVLGGFQYYIRKQCYQ